MKTYSNIGKNEAAEIHRELNQLIKAFAETRGLVYTPGNGKYTDSDITFTSLNLKVVGGKSIKEKRADADLKFALSVYGLSTEVHNNKQIVEYRARQHKYPVIYKNIVDGKLYKTSIEMAKVMFKAA